MYPAQSSLIPVQIALARFWETGGNIFGNYPYWYLGTTPYHNLTGPFIPGLLALIHRILPNTSLFTIMFGVIGVFWLIGGRGVYLLVKELAPLRPSGFARGTAFFYLSGPILPFLFRFADGLYLIAFSFLPFVLLKYFKLLRKGTKKDAIILMLLTSFLILLDSLIIPALVIGMISLLLAQGDWDHIEIKIKTSCKVLVAGLLVATIWYSPGYWLTLLGAPSLAGEGLLKVIASLGKVLPIALALAAAIFSARLFKKREILRDFTFYWFFIFGFLSLLRFLSDPDFWLDWTAYGLEIQFGMAIILALALQKTKDKMLKKYSVLAIYFLIFAFVSSKYILGTMQKDITSTVEYKIGKQIMEIVKSGDKVFLSGSTVFWLNAFFDIPQVRGGQDQSSINQDWRKAAWEIREDKSVEKGLEGLRKLGVTYLVVHTLNSKEYYHDFLFSDKFEDVSRLTKIYEKDGDRIYRLENR